MFSIQFSVFSVQTGMGVAVNGERQNKPQRREGHRGEASGWMDYWIGGLMDWVKMAV